MQDGRTERLPDLAAELVSLNVDVIVATGTPPPLAAQRATKTIPIVVAAAGDAVGTGLVASLARPGGNVTGLSLFSPELIGNGCNSSETFTLEGDHFPHFTGNVSMRTIARVGVAGRARSSESRLTSPA